MNWEDVLKVQELKPITTVLPKGEDKSEEDDGPCNRKLKQMAEEHKNMKPIFSHKSHITAADGEGSYTLTGGFSVWSEHEYHHPYEFYLKELIQWEYNPVPEKVACAALKLLSEKKKGRNFVDGFLIGIRDINKPNIVEKELSIFSNEGEGEVIIGHMVYPHEWAVLRSKAYRNKWLADKNIPQYYERL